MVELLLEAGADVLLLSEDGFKALDIPKSRFILFSYLTKSEKVKNLLQEAEDRIKCHGFKRAETSCDDDDDDDDDNGDDDDKNNK